MAMKNSLYTERTLDETLPELKPYLTSGCDVLDVGCGPGTITCDVAQIVDPGSVVGTDISRDSIREAKQISERSGLTNTNFKQMDTHALDFPDHSFDLVFSHTALHEFFDPIAALKEQKRVTKKGGWVIAAGVRDWGLVQRYPATPAWESLYDAWVRYYEFRRNLPEGDSRSIMPHGHPHAGRMCAEWFTQAGLTELDIQIKTYRIQYSGSASSKPDPLDLLPYDEEDEYGWYAAFTESYASMLADCYIDKDTLTEAIKEAKAWFQDPRAFHFWVMVFAAGRA